MKGYTHRAIFVGLRAEEYFLHLKLEGQNAQYLYFVMQASPLVDEPIGHSFYRVTFRKRDGRQVIENRRGQTIEGGWQLEGRAA